MAIELNCRSYKDRRQQQLGPQSRQMEPSNADHVGNIECRSAHISKCPDNSKSSQRKLVPAYGILSFDQPRGNQDRQGKRQKANFGEKVSDDAIGNKELPGQQGVMQAVSRPAQLPR